MSTTRTMPYFSWRDFQLHSCGTNHVAAVEQQQKQQQQNHKRKAAKWCNIFKLRCSSHAAQQTNIPAMNNATLFRSFLAIYCPSGTYQIGIELKFSLQSAIAKKPWQAGSKYRGKKNALASTCSQLWGSPAKFKVRCLSLEENGFPLSLLNITVLVAVAHLWQTHLQKNL